MSNIAAGSKLGIDATQELPAKASKRIGSDFDDFLKQDGLLAECKAGALKRVVTWQI
jgi:hypothetical protein